MAKYLVNTARSLIFSTALPPPAVAGAMAALELLAEQPHRVDKLQRNARLLADALEDEGLGVPGARTQILPVIVGEASAAVAASESLLERGIFAQAIRPPTVPENSSRLRLAVMSSHSPSELKPAAREIARAVRAAAPNRPLPKPKLEHEPAVATEPVRGRIFDHLSEAA
jgi:glycine C-acetyltransferase/8-amino-7-oxononanoate synthase